MVDPDPDSDSDLSSGRMPSGISRVRKDAGRACGFTLIELLVAMTGAMFVGMAAFAMAKQGSRFFQQEARIANAQYAATVGFDRLRADLARAGFLSTPNIAADPRVCAPAGGWGPAGIASLASIRLDPRQPSDAQDTTNQLSPDRILLSGSYASTELFPVRALIRNDGDQSVQVYLQLSSGAMTRTTGQLGTGALAEIFKVGRILRILDQESGHLEFGAITRYAPDEKGNPVVTLAGSPAIPFRRTGSLCGIDGFGVGTQASVISWIQYDIRKLSASTAGYAALFTQANAGIGDDHRLDLVREELDSSLKPMAGTLELVAEYAVDLKFAFTGVATQGIDPTLTRVAFGNDANNMNFGANIASTTARPDRIRSVQVRLAVRSREADRQVDLSLSRPTGNLFRYQLPGNLGYARARTLTSEVHLPNQAALAW